VHTVPGTFSLKDGSKLHFEPATGKAGGEVAMYATSGDSGNKSPLHELVTAFDLKQVIPNAESTPGRVWLAPIIRTTAQAVVIRHKS
jgi:hypothetical protein